MSGLHYRTASVCGALVLLAPGASTDAQASEADAAKVTATMQCDRVAEPGRVKCSLEARVLGSRSIVWADAALVELPEFMSALKGRIGPADATAREPALRRWAFGLVARKTGEGEAKARVRAVVCEPGLGDAGAPTCTTVTVDVRATVHVG